MNRKEMLSAPVVARTDIPGAEAPTRGKVRDIYKAGDRLLLVATDRISAFDCILGTGIPCKGQVLTQLSIFWFGFLKDIVPHHFLTARVDEYPEPFRRHQEVLENRSMLVKAATPVPIECVVRGYLSGSCWKEYRETGSAVGVSLPPGLRESERLPEPIFTPATKAQSGHDENISFATMADRIGADLAARLRAISLALYERAARHAEQRGIILADTKFEFGTDADGILLIDEALTPDSSRFWPRDRYQPGGPQPSFDKQFVRDYVESIGWNKQEPAPELPPDVVEQTARKYLEIFHLLTGRDLA